MTAALTRTRAKPLTRPVRGAGGDRDVRAADDGELLARVGRGDRDAWGELYRRHWGRVATYVRRRVAAEADVEDLVQEAFLHAWHNSGTYHPDRGYQVPSWLCLQAWRAVRDHAQHDLHRRRVAVETAREALRRPVTETAAEREARALSEPVRAAVAALPPSERRAVELRYLDGLSVEQAAAADGRSGKAITSAAGTARGKLARELADLARPAASPLAEMPRQEAVRIALATVGYDDAPAAHAWLRERGVRIERSSVYRVRRETPPEALTECRPEPPAYHPPAEVAGIDRPTDRARAVARDYRSRHGRVPTLGQLMTIADVRKHTAAVALRDAKADSPDHASIPTESPQAAWSTATILADVDGSTNTDAGEIHRAGAATDNHARRLGEVLNKPPLARTPTRHTATTAAPRQGVDHVVTPRASGCRQPDQGRQTVTDPAPPGRGNTHSHQHTSSAASSSREDASAEDETTAAAPAETSIARARVALAELTTRQAKQQRAAAEQARTEQLNQWHHDEHHHTARAATRARGRAHDGEGQQR